MSHLEIQTFLSPTADRRTWIPAFASDKQRRTFAAGSRCHRSGFGKIELVVVLVVICVLIALLLPAIQYAREQARRSSCGNNLKDLGLALLNYHDARKVFPSSQIYGSENVSPYGGKGEFAISCVAENQGPNWFVAIEPFIEQGGSINLYNKNAFYVDSVANVSYRSSNKWVMMCPSDVNAQTPYNGATMLSPAATQQQWQRGCYAVNAVVNDTTMGFLSGIPAEQQAPWTDWKKRGVMLPNIACRQDQITDGLAKTVLLAEIRADIGPGGNRGVWAGTSGMSALFGFGCATKSIGTLANDDIGPNCAGANSTDPTGDSSTTCKNAQSAAGGAAALSRLGMGCLVDPYDNKQSGPKSMHPGGLQTVFCDGAVHWIDDSVQVGSGANLGYWEMLFLSFDAGFLPADPYPLVNDKPPSTEENDHRE